MTYYTSWSGTPIVYNTNQNKLELSNLTSHGYDWYGWSIGYKYKWTLTASLTDQAAPGRTYKFKLKHPHKYAANTEYEIKASITSAKVDHVDIRMADAQYTVTTVLQTSDGKEISRSSETVNATVKDIKWFEIDGIKNTHYKKQSNNGRQEFRFQYGSKDYPKFEMNAAITANIDLLVSGKTINVSVTFTDAEKLQAILD